MAQTQLAKSGSIALLIKDGAIGRLPPKEVPNADWLPGSLLRLLLGECHVRPCISAEYQLSTRPGKTEGDTIEREKNSRETYGQ